MKTKNEKTVLSREEMKKINGGQALYWCWCDGDRSNSSLQTSPQAGIDWAYANCAETYQCDNMG